MSVFRKDKDYFIKKFAFVFNLQSNIADIQEKKQRDKLFSTVNSL